MMLAREEPEKTVSAIGDGLIETYHPRTLKDTHEIMYFSKEGRHKPGGEEVLESTVRSQVDRNISKHELSEILYYVQTMTYTDRSEFDKDLHILNLKNGLLNVETGEFVPHTPRYLSTVQLPVEYKPKQGCPNIARFLKETLDPEQIKVVVKMLGYILLRSAKYEKAFMLVGEGSNGKSTLLKLISAFVGKANAASVSLQDLATNRFAPAQLYGKMVNLFPDLKAERISDTGHFKALVSGDLMQVERKHQQPFEFENYAKLIFSANRIPDTSDDSYAYFRRWVILRFDRTFEGAAKDESLIEKLTTPEELSGLLNVALGGLKRLKAEKGFEHTDIDEIKAMYQEGASKIRDFIDEQCTIDTTNPELTVTTFDLHAAYAAFCKQRGTTFLDISRFGEELKALGVNHKLKRSRGTRVYIYQGIALKCHSVIGQTLTSFPTKENPNIPSDKRSSLSASDTCDSKEVSPTS